MKKTVLFVAFFLTCFCVLAQKNKTIRVPLSADKWTFANQKVEFFQEEGKPAMKIMPGSGQVVAKNLDFSDGTIEYDIKFLTPGFASTYFRWKDANENESFYFRSGRAGNPGAVDAVQYAPYISGVNLWDMLDHYQTNATFSLEKWNHVKLVLSGAQMRAYVNSQEQPTLEIPRLEGNTTTGSIAFDGDVMISNLVLKPGETEGLSSSAGIDPTHHDPRYIRSWAVSQPVTTPKNVDFSADFFPKPEGSWEVISAERRGLINLTRKFGKSETRRFVWLKAKINSATAQKKRIDLGFSDEVWVYRNNQLVYTDKNLYGAPIMKEPDGRISIENTSFLLPLNKGNNELLIGVANDFYGWGIIARIEDLEGIEIQPDPTFDSRMVKVSDQVLNAYAGRYVQANGMQITVARENNALKASGDNISPVMLYPESENKFFLKDFDAQMEFVKDATNKVSGLIIYNNGRQVMEAKRAD